MNIGTPEEAHNTDKTAGLSAAEVVKMREPLLQTEKENGGMASPSPEAFMPDEGHAVTDDLRTLAEAIQSNQQGKGAQEIEPTNTLSRDTSEGYSLVNADGSRKVFTHKKMRHWADNELGKFMAECEIEGLIPNENDGFISTMGKAITMPIKIPIKAVWYIGGKIKARIGTLFKRAPQNENTKPTPGATLQSLPQGA